MLYWTRKSHAQPSVVNAPGKIFNMSHRKGVRTSESFFAPNPSQSESEKNDTEQEQCINQEETEQDWRKPKKSRTFQKTWLRDHTSLRYEKEAYVYQ